jgi:hypothetical protein
MKSHTPQAIASILILCFVGIGIAAVSLRTRQHLIRVRAQHTLDEIQNLEIGSLRACQVFSEWQTEWGSHLTSHAPCNDPDHFYMDINVQNPPSVGPCFVGHTGYIRVLSLWASCGVYEALSGNPIVFIARIEAVQGVVTRKVSEVITVRPDESPDEHKAALVSAIAMTSARFDNILRRQSAIQQQSLHPNYYVFVGRSRVNADYMPGARVFYIEAELGPDANKADTQRMFRFDLSCISRTRPCSQQDLMPAAYEQYQVDAQSSQPKIPGAIEGPR